MLIFSVISILLLCDKNWKAKIYYIFTFIKLYDQTNYFSKLFKKCLLINTKYYICKSKSNRYLILNKKYFTCVFIFSEIIFVLQFRIIICKEKNQNGIVKLFLLIKVDYIATHLNKPSKNTIIMQIGTTFETTKRPISNHPKQSSKNTI